MLRCLREETQSSAAMAFKHMCEGTSRHLVDEPHGATATATATATAGSSSSSSLLPSLLAVYAASSSLRLPEQLAIIEGMCSVVSVLDQPRLSQYLQPLLQPILHTLHASAEGGAKAPVAVVDCLERLGALFQHLEPHHNDSPELVRSAIMQCTQHCWPLLERLTAQYGSDERCMEKVCRCWRYAMKKSGDRRGNSLFAPALPAMLQAVAAQYQRHHTAYAHTKHTLPLTNPAAACTQLTHCPSPLRTAPSTVACCLCRSLQYVPIRPVHSHRAVQRRGGGAGQPNPTQPNPAQQPDASHLADHRMPAAHHSLTVGIPSTYTLCALTHLWCLCVLRSCGRQPMLYSTYRSMAAATLSLLSTTAGGVSVAASASASSSSPPDLVEDFFELSARVLGRLPALAFDAEQRELQASLVACACQCLLMPHRQALNATCHFLATLLSEGSDAALANSKRGRPLQPQHGEAVLQLLVNRQLAAHMAQSLAYDIAVHLPHHYVHNLAEPLLLLYYCVPQQFATLLSHALQPYTLPPQPQPSQSTAVPATAPLDAATIERFVSQMSQLAESAATTPAHRIRSIERSAKEVIDAFAQSCRQKVQR